MNLEKVTEHAGPVLRGRAWAHAGPHALVCVWDKGLQWRQPWTRDSILRATLARWVVGCKTAEAWRTVGLGFGGLAVRWPEAVPPCEELRERLCTALGCYFAPRSPTQVIPDSSLRPRAYQRSASGGQDVVWQGGGPVRRRHDQGWRGLYLLLEILENSGEKKTDEIRHSWLGVNLDAPEDPPSPGKEAPVVCIRRPPTASHTGSCLPHLGREGLTPSEIVLETIVRWQTGGHSCSLREARTSPVLRGSTWCQTYPAPSSSGAQPGLQPVREILAQDRTGESAKDSGSLLQPRLPPCGR